MRRQSGFSYLALLIAVAIIAVSAGAAVQAGALLQRRAAEQELLAIGHEFRSALVQYARMTPAGQLPYPQSLDDLLRDPRSAGVVRHLRRIYADPVTGRPEWGLIRGPEDRILGIHSLSDGIPIKIGGFATPDAAFADARSYRDWVFSLPNASTPRPMRVDSLPSGKLDGRSNSNVSRW